MEWYLKVLRQYTDFVGRARRQEYWMFTLFNTLAYLGLFVIGMVLHTGLLGLLYGLAVLVPGLAVAVRRLHDTGRSGWWLLIGLIPLIGAIVLIVFLVTEGERQPNAYGPDPKATADPVAALA
ncbi:MAG: DUF805 domain-containing protein [Pseudonocardiaceae bacterium]